jgi:hypothetical protein
MFAFILLAIAVVGPTPPIDVESPLTSERLQQLAEYHIQRDRAKITAKDQLALAEWCEQGGLKLEAAAHYTVVTRLDPQSEIAWTKLGCRNFEGAWRSAEQIALIQTDRLDRKQAEARYLPWLTSWANWLRNGGDIQQATKVLDRITDPRAVSSIHHSFAAPRSLHQNLAVRMLAAIDSNESTLELCILAVDGSSPATRRQAGKAIENRDPRIFVGYLINRLREPTRYEVRAGESQRSAGELWVEERKVIINHIYDLPQQAYVPPPRIETVSKLDSSGLWRRYTRETTADKSAADRDAREDVHSVEKKLAHDVRILELENYSTEQSNERVLPLLRQSTGQYMGPDREAWTSWWTNQIGYSYQSRQVTTDTKPVVIEHIQPAAPRPVVFQVTDTPVPRSSRSCFAQGTLVRTEVGLRPIESLAVGDLVLAQSTKTGMLRYRPITTTFHNPPAATLRVDLGKEAIVSTGIHRFWVVSTGWVMARDLRVGARIHCVKGEASVVSVTPDAFQKVFNLEIGGDSDFFVGQEGALVHDNSIVRPTTRPFDAK